LGFIGCEGVDVDAEDFDDFIGESLFQYFQCLVIWAERFVSTSMGYLCDLHKIFVSAWEKHSSIIL
jgi:hypothetical protein